MRRILISLLLAVSVQVAFAAPIVLSAEPGSFNGQPIKGHASSNQIKGSILIRSFKPEPSWPPAAYMGMYQGQDRNNSIQAVVIRNKPSDKFLVVGYRLVVEGKEAKIASITNVGLHEPIKVNMSFTGGVATLQINQSKPVVVHTPFSNVGTYVSVSSAEAVFEIAP